MNRAIITVVCAAALAGGCGAASATNSPSAPAPPHTTPATTAAAPTTPKPAHTPPPKPGTAVRVVDSQYGRILADRRGQAFYLFDRERSGRLECYDACAVRWPPVLSRNQPVAGPGAHASQLGTIRRRDGRLQVTYGGHPLYYYFADGPGRILCQDAEEFGGLWLVVAGNGQPVR